MQNCHLLPWGSCSRTRDLTRERERAGRLDVGQGRGSVEVAGSTGQAGRGQRGTTLASGRRRSRQLR
jgi:hypothetical protein